MFFNLIVDRPRTIGSFSDTGIFIGFELTNDDVTVFIDVWLKCVWCVVFSLWIPIKIKPFLPIVKLEHWKKNIKKSLTKLPSVLIHDRIVFYKNGLISKIKFTKFKLILAVPLPSVLR